MSKIPEQILQAGCSAYCAKFLHGLGSLGDGIEAAYFAIHDHNDWVKAGPKAWGGEGMPPIGIEIEVVWNDRPSIFKRAFVVAHDEGRVVYRWLEGDKAGSYQADALRDPKYCPANPMFRPIRTPEQIAAELEATTIKEIAIATGLRARDGQMEVARALYDAGYRKFKIVDEQP